MAAIAERVTDIEVKVETFSKDMAEVKGVLGSLDMRMAAVERRLEAIDGRLFAMMTILITVLLAILGGFVGVFARLA